MIERWQENLFSTAECLIDGAVDKVAKNPAQNPVNASISKEFSSFGGVFQNYTFLACLSWTTIYFLAPFPYRSYWIQ